MINEDLKTGMKVRVIDWKERPDHWNFSGYMDRWCGEIVTIRRVSLRIKIQEDFNDKEASAGWSWFASDFVEIGAWGIKETDWEI